MRPKRSIVPRLRNPVLGQKEKKKKGTTMYTHANNKMKKDTDLFKELTIFHLDRYYFFLLLL